MGLAETAKLAVQLSLKDGLSPGLSKASKNLRSFDSGVGRAGKGAGQLAGSLAKIGAVAGTVAAVGLYKSAQAAIDWQDAFQGVVKTVDAAELERAGLSFDKLGMSLRDMALTMPSTAIELAGIAETAGALGIKAKDIQSFTRQVAILAATTNVSADEAAMSLGQLQNVIGLTGDEFDNFAAALVDLGNKGASTESQILEIARRAGAAAKLFGIAKDETLGWAAAAANLGMEPELAGSSLQRMFMKLLPNFARGENKMAEFMGMTNKAMKSAFGKDASGMLQKFVKRLAALPKDARLEAIQGFFGKEGVGLQRLILGLADSMDTNLTPSLETSTQAWADATAAQVEFDKRTQTVKSKLQILRNGLTDAAITIGEGFTPALGRAAEKLAAFLKQPGNRAQLKALGEDIGKAIDSIDWERVLRAAQGVAAALKPALSLVMQLADMIAKLPPELVGGAATLIVANKITGGGLSAGVGNIIGGLGETLARSMASKIPLFGPAFVQPVFVTNMGGLPAGVAGAAGTAGVGAALTAVLAPASVALLGVAIGNVMFRGVPALVAEIWGKPKPEAGVNERSARDPGFQGMRQVNALLANVPRKIEATTAAVRTASANDRGEQAKVRAAIDGMKSKQGEAIVAFRAAERTFANQKPPTVNVSTNVKVSVTASDVKKSVVVHDRYGERAPSRNGGTARIKS